MSNALDILTVAEKSFANEHGLPRDALNELHELRRREMQDMPTELHQIAVWIVAPVLAGFAEWMAGRGARQKNPLFIGVMREGRLLARLMQNLFGIPAREVWLNRNLSMLAAFGCGDDEALMNWLIRTRLQPLSKGQAVRFMLGKEDEANADFAEVITLENCGRILEQWKKSGLLAEARERALGLADRLVNHWQKTCGACPSGDAVLLMDFASAGNIQRSLQTIFAAKGLPHSITGLNFAMTSGSHWAEAAGCVMHGFMSERGAPEWFAAACARTPELMEVFTAAPVGSLEDYREDGDPICGACFLTNQRQVLLRDVQKRILDAAVVYHRALGERLTADIGRCLWGRLLLCPSVEEAEALADWPLDAGLDGSAQRVLAAKLSGSPEAWTKMQSAWPAGSAKLQQAR